MAVQHARRGEQHVKIRFHHRLAHSRGWVVVVGRPTLEQCDRGLGAQLCAEDGTLINRDYERAWLPSHLQAGATLDIPITVKAPETPGRYVLKFDLVSEGIDWFEASGSQTTTRPLVVR